MSRLKFPARSIAVVAACVACSGEIHSQESAANDKAVIARSIGKPPERIVVAYVARNAVPTTFDPVQRPNLAKASVRETIESMCGSVPDGYLGELAQTNPGQNFSLDQPLGKAAYSVQWPACLYARNNTARPVTYTVKENDTLTGIRQRFTGAGNFDSKEIDEFFGDGPVKSANALELKVGTKLPIKYTTAATALQSRVPSATFVAMLTSLGGSSVAIADDLSSPGEIVGPVRFEATGAQGAFTPCARGDGSRPYPFDAAQVARTYETMVRATPNALSGLSLVVVDNGFFGAHCPSPDKCPEMNGDRVLESDRFPNSFFDALNPKFKDQLGYGPMLSGQKIAPLNFSNKSPMGVLFQPADINEETGHGTHVTGLVLGGPSFMPHRDSFKDLDKKPWLNLALVNLSRGSKKLAIGTDQSLFIHLSQEHNDFRVVNLSIAFDARVDGGIATNLRSAMRGDDNSLFIAAAGNMGGNLEGDAYELYPARFGGGGTGSMANVMTVASIDGPVDGVQRLSAFSNRSGEYVDLAAPGCQISSWVDADNPAIEISGTSQAAPLVSFSMALLRSMWRASPAQLKNRALYSGDLLESVADRSVVWSKSQLNIEKTLTYLWDRVTYMKDGQSFTKFGQLSAVQGLRCDSGAGIIPANLKAIKRAPNNRVALYTVDSGQILRVCWGRIDPATKATLRVEKEWIDGKILPFEAGPNIPSEIDLDAGQILEVIKNQ